MADQWFYTCNGKQMDPVPTAELKKLAASGLVKPTDMVWQEGMANWIRASAARGLFEDGPTGTVLERGAPGDRPSRSGRRSAEDGNARREPRRNDDMNPDRPRQRRPANEGMGGGAKVAIILGVVILVLGSIVGGVVLLLNSSQDAKRNNFVGVKDKKDGLFKVGNAPINYTINLGGNQSDVRQFEFRANTTYEFQFTSDFLPDFDFFIHDQNKIKQYLTQTFNNQNHRVTWTAPFTGTFRLELVQYAPQTRTQVTIRELGPGIAFNPLPKQVVPPPKFVDNPPALGNVLTVGFGGITKFSTINPNDPLDPGGLLPCPCHVYQVKMEAGRNYQIDLMSRDFDAYLRLEDSNFFQLAKDDDGGEGLNSRIFFNCNRTDNYRIICRALGDNVGLGQYTMKVATTN